MSTLQLSDTLLDDYVALFRRLGAKDQATLIDKLTEATNGSPLDGHGKNLPAGIEKLGDPSGEEAAWQMFGAWGAEEDQEDVERMVQAIEFVEGRDFYYLPEPANPRSFEELAGSWEDDRTTEEIIADLRRSRTPNRDKVNL